MGCTQSTIPCSYRNSVRNKKKNNVMIINYLCCNCDYIWIPKETTKWYNGKR